MKVINLILAAVVVYFGVFRLLLPKLISTNNDSAVLAGVAIVLVLGYYAASYGYKQIKGNDNEE